MFNLSLIVLLSLLGVDDSLAAPKKPTPKVNITYTGSGFADLQDDNSQNSSQLIQGQMCRVDRARFTEQVNSVSWNLIWNKLTLQSGANTKPNTSAFSAKVSQTARSSADLSSCPPSNLNNCKPTDPDCVLLLTQCTDSVAQHFSGIIPGLNIAKQGKSFIVTLRAEDLLETTAATGSQARCFNSTVFDNNIVEGMRGENITEVKIKLTPSDKKKKTTIQVPLHKSYDCTDPARNGAPYLTNSCTLNSSFDGTVVVQGKWKAKLL